MEEFTTANPAIWKECGTPRVRDRLGRAYQHAAYAAFLSGDYVTARRLYFRAVRWTPWRMAPLAYGLVCLAGPTGIGVARAVKRWLHVRAGSRARV